MSDRLEVHKTYKLFIGGAFPRSESGRSYEVVGHDGAFLANAVRASRKDVRDAVAAARKASAGWAGITAYNRGQILYRVAEIMESRRAGLVDEVTRAEGDDAASQVDEAIDLFVWYAGWSDKVVQVAGNQNPVAGPYFNLTVPEPSGVAALVVPASPSLLGIVARLAPALCAGCTIVALASEAHPLSAVALAECLASADVPPGAVNILTGLRAELAPVVAGHMDVDVLDLTGVSAAERAALEETAAINVKRIVHGSDPSPYEVTAFMDHKTIWHPKGA